MVHSISSTWSIKKVTRNPSKMLSNVTSPRFVFFPSILCSPSSAAWQDSQVNAPKVQYDYFDFHRECKNMRWDRIGLLLNRIKDDLIEKGCVIWLHGQLTKILHLLTWSGTFTMTFQGLSLASSRAVSFAPTAWTIWIGRMLCNQPWQNGPWLSNWDLLQSFRILRMWRISKTLWKRSATVCPRVCSLVEADSFFSVGRSCGFNFTGV